MELMSEKAGKFYFKLIITPYYGCSYRIFLELCILRIISSINQVIG